VLVFEKLEFRIKIANNSPSRWRRPQFDRNAAAPRIPGEILLVSFVSVRAFLHERRRPRSPYLCSLW
jgi:hypothetical protein